MKRQAKELLAAYRRGDADALARFRASLPAAQGRDDASLAAQRLRLHDAQSCLAREYGFPSWADLDAFVASRRATANEAEARLEWLRLVYAGDISGSMRRPRPAAAVRLLAETPDVAVGDPILACAMGDATRVRQAIARDPTWVDRPGGPLNLPPLVAVTHSSLVRVPGFTERLRDCAGALLAAGADPNQAVGNRWPPASVAQPSETERLSALYGAAGQNHDPGLTALLLQAGADPNDGESLYHALESPACVDLLLKAGARVSGSNALYRALDMDNLPVLQLLLAHGGDANEQARNRPLSDWGSPLLWAIHRRRSPAHIAALLAAGADPSASTPDGIAAYTVALRYGMTEVADLLRQAGGDAPLSVEDRFMAACAAGDEAAARTLQAQRADLPVGLSEARLRLLPDLAAQGGCDAAIAVMVRLGWPLDVQAGDWNATALNHAVFRGDAALARFLLDHGARWTERHGYGDDVSGTLSWASLNLPEESGDWPACAQALLDHGLPVARAPADGKGGVLVDGQRKWFSEEVTEVLLGVA
ncbi:ankyrin repeat domain-containing protein [Nitrospirillum sp. BR 11752]|uniref:ankyrin repeat domain-containing protein n=1 Tax=Nitrospirillum sp. BR 11752 TaxID=3104293 RepID=UPI002E991858|nr:ankyrin repeat domain-containing protein [Nitrospirillum sp. BR 11752]